MIPTKTARRAVAALAVPVLLLTAACGSDGEDEGPDGASGPVTAVTGEQGEQPEFAVDEDAEVGEETVVEVLEEGDGAEVGEGDFLRLDVVGRTVHGDLELVNTWKSPDGEELEEGAEGTQDAEGAEGGEDGEADAAPERKLLVTQAGTESSLPAPVTAPLVGAKVGSRVQVEGRAAELLGPVVQQMPLSSEEEGLVWVFDIVEAIDAKARAEGEQAPVEEGMPEVEADGEEPAAITIPEGQDPPEELRQQVLIEGEGPEVKAGQTLIAQYTGVLWADGEKFDSSWDRQSASMFQIGVGKVVPGWDEGLVGKNVGDRVLLVLPPDMGYGEEGNDSIPGGSTLVFVVDIVGVA